MCGSFLPSPQLVRVFSLPKVTTHSLAHHTGYDLGYAFTGPWVTSVGGTTGAYPEVAAKISGGGFSLYFPRPPYQDLAVPTFLQNIGSQYYGLFKSVRCCQFYPFNF